MRRFVTCLFSVFVFVPLVFADDFSSHPEVVKSVDDFLKDKESVGVVVGIRTAGKTVIRGFGTTLIGKEAKIPNGETLFEIGSITKLFTGTLLADCVGRNVAKLDDPAANHLPDDLMIPTYDEVQITLLDLATHRSSLPVQPPAIGLIALFRGTTDDPYQTFSLQDLRKTLKKQKLLEPIGSKFIYSKPWNGSFGRSSRSRRIKGCFQEIRLRTAREGTDSNSAENARHAHCCSKGKRASLCPRAQWIG